MIFVYYMTSLIFYCVVNVICAFVILFLIDSNLNANGANILTVEISEQ